ncbi:hypothetical protein KIPB_002055 [Kipferlia bialata]|uniref:Uncharacterized protein n=1 Tax=Kipferlia bialata TaxID=797122 RepID=A0A9K3GGE1_9EUKA|nr:hypothetical protein KIPB_002055 [Kipferlia bialata]|eukprot:g2055.t1
MRDPVSVSTRDIPAQTDKRILFALGPKDDSGVYYLERELQLELTLPQYQIRATLREGFQTDLRSGPDVLDLVGMADHDFPCAWLMHDVLYAVYGTGEGGKIPEPHPSLRGLADSIMRDIIQGYYGAPVRGAVAHAGVAVGGGPSWRTVSDRDRVNFPLIDLFIWVREEPLAPFADTPHVRYEGVKQRAEVLPVPEWVDNLTVCAYIGPLTPEGGVPDYFHPTEPYAMLALAPDVTTKCVESRIVTIEPVSRTVTVDVIPNPFQLLYRMSATRVGAHVYVYGGLTTQDHASASDALYTFHIPTEQWRQIPKRGRWPCARCGHVAFTLDGRLHVMGGYTPEELLVAGRFPIVVERGAHDHWIYTPSTERWHLAHGGFPMVVYKLRRGGVVSSDVFYLISKAKAKASENLSDLSVRRPPTLLYSYTDRSGWQVHYQRLPIFGFHKLRVRGTDLWLYDIDSVHIYCTSSRTWREVPHRRLVDSGGMLVLALGDNIAPCTTLKVTSGAQEMETEWVEWEY